MKFTIEVNTTESYAHVTCKEANMRQAFLLEDLPDLLKDIPNLLDQ